MEERLYNFLLKIYKSDEIIDFNINEISLEINIQIKILDDDIRCFPNINNIFYDNNKNKFVFVIPQYNSNNNLKSKIKQNKNNRIIKREKKIFNLNELTEMVNSIKLNNSNYSSNDSSNNDKRYIKYTTVVNK
jgi:hypothetical protein